MEGIHWMQLYEKILTLKQVPKREGPFCSLIIYTAIPANTAPPSLAFLPLTQNHLSLVGCGFWMHANLLYNRMSSKEALRERYQSTGSKRQYNGVRMSKEVSELILFIDNSIKKEFESFSLFSTICGGERRIKVDPQFESAFLALSLDEKITYYETAQQREPSIELLAERELEFEVLPIKVIKGLKNGPNYKIKLPAYLIDCSHYEISLSHYILRRSKKNSQIFIFESLIQQEPLAVRFELANYTSSKDAALTSQNLHSWTKYVISLNRIEQLPNKVKLSKKEKDSEASPPKKAVTSPHISKENSPHPNHHSQLDIQSKSNISPIHFHPIDPLERSVIEQVFHGEDNIEEEIYELVEQKETQIRQDQSSKSFLRRWRKNVAAVILPNLSLLDIENFQDYLPVMRDDARRLYIYQHSLQRNHFRMELYLRHGAELVVKHLCEIQNYKLWNGSINESHVKLSISSDNAYLAYFKHRAYGHLYRQRDFLFLRHLCRAQQAYFLVDCSVQNSHFIPFAAIQRGTIHHSITKLEEVAEGQSRLLMDLSIDHGGILQGQAQEQLTLRFLKEFVGLQSHITRFKGQFKCPYDLDWEVVLTGEKSQCGSEMGNSNVSLASHLFEQPLSSFSLAHNDEDEFYSIADQNFPPQEFELTEEEFLKTKRQEIVSFGAEVIDLNSQGLVVLPKKYLRVRHATLPSKVQERRTQHPYPNLMLKNDFVEDNGGGMKLSNQVKAAAQNNVIKFIMSTIKKNIFSGKGILNISLPVQIFNCDSNIQRLCESLSMAPDLLQRRACAPGVSAVERFKACVAFAFTASVLYFDIDKPFNPILGETFQGFIDGCPVYGEQISHHPPISSILLFGRGYRIYGNLEAKVYVHLNSGEGVNEGFCTIQFDDGGKVVFQTAPGEVSGLAVGDRKFRFKGKTFVVDAKNRLFCAINFEDQSGIFSKNKWKFEDQVQGEIMRVSQGFIRNFFESKQGKEGICPGKKEIEERLGKLSGRWIEAFLIDGKQYFNLRQAPHQMVHYEFPLNSNSDYREDLLYRKRNDLARSQNEKERLEVVQRNDRKLREKYHPGSH